MGASTESFGVLLESHKWIALPASLAVRRSGSSVGEAAGAGGAAAASASSDKLAEAGGGGGSGDAAGGPPYSLMEHTPLAVYTNGLLAAFNELRHCAPLSLREATAAVLEVGGGQWARRRRPGDCEAGCCRRKGQLAFPVCLPEQAERNSMGARASS